MLTITCNSAILRSMVSDSLLPTNTLLPHFQIPIRPHSRANIRKSEIKLDNAFKRFAVANNRDGGIVVVSMMTVVFGGNEMAFSMILRTVLCSRWVDIDDRTVEVRREL